MSLIQRLPPNTKQRLRRYRDAAKTMKRRLLARLHRPNLFRLSTAERVGIVYTCPSDMRMDERIFLYALVRGLRPERALEIGVLAGGGGAIMANAMEENGFGKIIGLDPDPQLRVTPAQLHGRYQVIREPSPQGLPQARAAAGGLFDFALIDGLHRYDQVRLDIAATLPHLRDGAFVLLHDAFHYGVAAAIKEAIETNASLHDCGYVCRTARMDNDPYTPYNGFRLLRFSQAAIADSYETVRPLYAANKQEAPMPAPDIYNHDGWYCRDIEPCPRCIATGRNPAKPAGKSS